jgi:hypothetical protein
LHTAYVKKEFAALTQLVEVPAEISPRSALARSDDRKVIILFSVRAGLFLQIQQMHLEILHPSSLEKPISLLSYGSRLA